MATQEQLKERAVFYIERRISALDVEDADHEGMAKDSVPYTDRKRVEAQLAEKKEKRGHELEAMQWARDKLKEIV